jgi:hypothetical protein
MERKAMSTTFRITIRNEQDEVVEFDSTEPIVHIDIPAGRYLITVTCAAGEQPADKAKALRHKIH